MQIAVAALWPSERGQPASAVDRRGTARRAAGSGTAARCRGAADRGRSRGVRRVARGSDVAVVAGEALVAAVAVERDGDVPRASSRRGRRWASPSESREGLAVVPRPACGSTRARRARRRNSSWSVPKRSATCAGVRQLVEVLVVEADREGLAPARRMPRPSPRRPQLESMPPERKAPSGTSRDQPPPPRPGAGVADLLVQLRPRRARELASA